MKVQGAILLATLVVCQLVFSGGCFLDATGYSSGGDGGAGGGNSSTGGQDCQSSGNTGGDSTSNSTAGSTSSSASECATSAGGGGEGGGTSSSGGGGSGGSTSSTGGGGGEGGGNPTGCEAGTEGTPDLLEGWGNGASAGLLVQEDGSSEFQFDSVGGEANKVSYALNSTDKFPGQLVLTGGNGIHMRMMEGGQDQPQATYLVQGGLIPYGECEADFFGEDCLTLVAKDYRCQNGSGEPDCPAQELVYVSQGNLASYDLNVDGNWLVLVDIQCDP
jgi:hypothetical protein